MAVGKNYKGKTINFEEYTIRSYTIAHSQTDTASNTAETQNRLAKAIKTSAQCKLCFDKAHTSIAWKLRAFNSIVISKLMYGLETIQLTQKEMNKIEQIEFVPNEMLRTPQHSSTKRKQIKL